MLKLVLINNSYKKILAHSININGTKLNKGKIIGVVDEDNLLRCVIEKSFKHKIRNYYTTKIKSVPHDLDIKKLLNIFKKENFVFVYKRKNFIGMISRNDLLHFLKRNSNVKK